MTKFKYPIFFTCPNAMKCVCVNAFLTKSTVFLLLVSLRVSPTKLSQRPLQSSGSSVVIQVIMIPVSTLISQPSSLHKLGGSFDIFLHYKPLIRSLIWEWASPFSRFWTTVFAILVRWPIFPLRLPPSALEMKVEKL